MITKDVISFEQPDPGFFTPSRYFMICQGNLENTLKVRKLEN